MEIVVITYGKEETGESFSAISFTEKTEALNFCRIINKLELKDNNCLNIHFLKIRYSKYFDAVFFLHKIKNLLEKMLNKAQRPFLL
ncbi:hypothetical protein AGMMS49546_36210 [Spirochaetia bacterium]|nr:hypothetical protein AGMMS49546_36210 [Spirochaetia bacterium]